MSLPAQFTCITCRVAFNNADIQRDHYKTDWHRYNLKRKVAELPSITSDEFQKRVYQQREKDEAAAKVDTAHCQTCRKHFNTINAYENHLNSKRHKDNVVINDNASDSVLSTASCENVTFKTKLRRNSLSDEENMDIIEEVDSDEWDEDTENPIENNNCLFCVHHSKNLVKNLNHMSIAHGFFVPDVEYCTDVLGLLTYLGEKVTQGFMCLWCNDRGRTFHTADAAKQHMIDKGHCKMLHEGIALAEYADYYDYSTSYPDQEEDDDDDSEVSIPVLDDSDYQLVLPSGVTVGHRSLMRYYKQSIDPNRQEIVPKSNRKLHKVLAEYRALGWTATQQEAAAKKARDLHYMKRMQSKAYTKLGIKANKFQKHFRQQVNF